MAKQSTIAVYPLDGTNRKFVVPYEYLARRFVTVALLGTDRKPLVLGTDFRFISANQIETTQAWGDTQGYANIEVRRETPATQRLVDFYDGSVLRSRDLNVSAIQTIHIAEEARNLAAYTLATDDDGNLDARGRRLVNLGDAVNPKDALTLEQVMGWSQSALNQANRSQAEADKSAASAQAAAQSATQSDAAALRQDLANPDLGAGMVKGASIYVGSVAELKGLAVAVGHKVSTLGYYTSGDGGGIVYEIVAGGTGTADGGSFIDLDNGLQAKGIFDGVIDVRKFGAKGDGATDDTAAIQAAIDFGSIVFPSGTFMIDGNDPAGQFGRQGVDVPSNRAISWLQGAEVKILPSSETGYNAFLVKTKSDVHFMNPRIRGDRYDHIGTTGEWGMGIEMLSASRVLIDNPDIRDCWGDGIYIGQANEAAGPCKDIWINNGIVDNNRRQGMSVISVDGLFVNNTQFNNTNGTAPEAGVDFEPNHPYEVLRRVRFNGVTTKGNKSAGILFWMHNLGSVAGAHIDMQFDGLYDEGSSRGVYIGSQFNNSGTGQIVFNNPVSKNATQGAFAIRNWHRDAPRIYFNNPLAINATTRSPASETENSGFSVFTTGTFTETLGGFEIHNYKSINDGTVTTYAIRTLRLAVGVENVRVSRTGGQYSNIGHAFAAGVDNEITDLPQRILKAWPGTSPVTQTLHSGSPHTEVQNEPTKHCFLTLPSISGTSQLVLKAVFVGGDNDFKITPPSGQSLNSGGLFSAGMELAPADRKKGASVNLRVINDEWHVESYVGNWSALEG